MLRVAIVAGTRPEVVKLAPVRAMLNAGGGFEVCWVSTEQQSTLNEQALAVFGIEPEARLSPPGEGESLGARFAHVMGVLDKAFARLQPDLVIVQGDTSSTAAGAMAAFARQIPVAHVEAGLRTFDLDTPFPEEGWRCVVGQLAAVHFAPTPQAAENLLRCGVPADRINMTGNTGIDSVRLAAPSLVIDPPVGRRITATLHRREHWDASLDHVMEALLDIRDRTPDLEVVFVSHANPALKSRVMAHLAGQERVRVADPMDYMDFLALLKGSSLVLSDSGGVQEEATVLGVPALILRDSTERPEAITAGVSRLVGVNRERIVAETCGLLNDEAALAGMRKGVSPFGDGYASERIAEVLAVRFGRPAQIERRSAQAT